MFTNPPDWDAWTGNHKLFVATADFLFGILIGFILFLHYKRKT